MYCTVALSFQSELKPLKSPLVYKVGIHNVRTNDVVEVSYRGKLTYGVVGGVYSRDTFNHNGMHRMEIERILHTNTVYAAVRRRFNMFKDFKINHQRKTGQRIIKLIEKNHGVEFRHKVMKYVCLGNMKVEKDGHITIWHANQRLSFLEKNGEYVLVGYERYKEFKNTWRTSLKAENYFIKLYDEYYGNS